MDRRKCVNCVWFPWKPDANLTGLPAMRCHPSLTERKWSRAGAELQTICPYYKAKSEPVLEHEVPKTLIEIKPNTKPKPKKKHRAKKE